MSIIKVKTGGITADAVTATEIADNAVVTAAINADAVTDAKIADDVVGTEHLTANEVDTAALGADAVTGAQLADNAVNSEHYTDGSIDTAHIADAQITSAKLASGVGGKLLQVVNAHTATNTTSNSTSYADTNLSCNITPSASSSKVLVLIQQSVRKSGGDTKGNIRVYRDSTEIGGVIAGREIGDTDSTASNSVGTGFSYSYLDSPSSSSQLTYKTQFNNVDGTGTVAVNYSSHQSYMTLIEVAG
jgi:hypothetical protein